MNVFTFKEIMVGGTKSMAFISTVLTIEQLFAPEYPGALSHLAAIYARTGNYDKAIALYQELITRQPNNPDTFFYIACVYAKQNKKTEAIDWLKKAAERGYRNPNIFSNGLDLNRILRPSFTVEKRLAVETLN